MTVEGQIFEFMKACGQTDPVDREDMGKLVDFRISLMDEEYDELIEALQWGDPVHIAKELADMVYVVVGTAIALGIPFTDVFDVVHASNMSKVVGEDGETKFSEEGKVLKNENFVKAEPGIKKVMGL